METTKTLLRAFVATHEGIDLPGQSIIIAESEEKAVIAINKTLKGKGLDDTVTTDDLSEIDITKPNVTVINNGEY